MLDMGFATDINNILDNVAQSRQIAMFTAIWAPQCRTLASKYISNPVHIQVGPNEITANPDVAQHVEIARNTHTQQVARSRENPFNNAQQ